jgi:hypothetical protein
MGGVEGIAVILGDVARPEVDRCTGVVSAVLLYPAMDPAAVAVFIMPLAAAAAKAAAEAAAVMNEF